MRPPDLENNTEVKIHDHASDILAVEIVAGGADVPGTPVGGVAGFGAGTEDPTLRCG